VAPPATSGCEGPRGCSPKVPAVTGDEGKPWRWPGQWMRQESFWRDVGSRTLAAVFAAGIVYVFAVAAGYVSRPDGLPVGLLVTWVIVSLWFHVKSSKLDPNSWYGKVPTWLLRLGEWTVNVSGALLIYWVFFS
jgi:hypothetical protein